MRECSVFDTLEDFSNLRFDVQLQVEIEEHNNKKGENIEGL